MNRLLIAITCVLLALPAPAIADDFPELPTAYNWTGLYVGPNAGIAFAGEDRGGLHVWEGRGPLLSEGEVGTLGPQGMLGGGQAGFNVQSGHLVWGFEGNFDPSDADDEISAALEDGEAASAEAVVNWFSTARGRAGWAVDNVLFYGTGGVAIADIDYRVRVDGDQASALTAEGTEVGYTLGGGFELAADNDLSFKLEYQYLNFGRDKAAGRDFDEPGEVAFSVKVPDFHSVIFGLNYRF